MSNILFLGEQLAGHDIEDLYDYDPTKQYILTFDPCGKRQLTVLDTYLQGLPGYAAGPAQTLQHDGSGNLQWA